MEAKGNTLCNTQLLSVDATRWFMTADAPTQPLNSGEMENGEEIGDSDCNSRPTLSSGFPDRTCIKFSKFFAKMTQLFCFVFLCVAWL